MPEGLCGREAELARLHALLDDVASSTALAAVVEGPAGIGKSSLLQALIDGAAARGFSIFSTRSEEMERERAFGAIARLAEAMRPGSGKTFIDLLEDDLPQTSAFRLVDMFVDLIEARALNGPLLISFDDAQWADEWSIRAIGILFRRLRGLPLALSIGLRPTPRSQELATLVASLSEEGCHLALGALDSQAVAEVIRQLSGREPSAHLLGTFERAGGNPFFVHELFDALRRDQLLVSPGDALDVAASSTPPALLVTVLHRMRALSEEVLDIVRTAAVLSGTFTVHQMAVATERPVDSLLKPLLQLRDEGILTEEGESFRFRHDLIREAVYEDLGGPVRAAMHARLGHALADSGGDVVEAAQHLLRGAQPGDTAAADRLIEAVESGRITLVESVTLLRRALELAPHHPRFAALKRRIATLLYTADRPREATPLLEEILSTTHDPAEQLKIVGALSVAALRAGDSVTQRTWRRQAGELAKGLRASQDLLVVSGVAQCFYDEGEWERATIEAKRGLALATASGDRPMEEEFENTCTWLLTGQGFPLQALEHSTRAVRLSVGRPSEPMRRIHHAGARRSLWEFEVARSELAAARRRAGELGAAAIELKALSDSCLLDYAAGRWEDALLHADTAWEMTRELGIASDNAHPAFTHAWVNLRRACFEEVDRLLAVASNRLHGLWIRLLLAVAREREQEISTLCNEAVDYRRVWPYTPHAEGVLADVARAAKQFGFESTAQEALQVAINLGEGTEAPSRQLEALRCRTIVGGDQQAAAEALQLADACPWPLDRAATFEDVAQALPAQRSELLPRALEIYARLGSVFDQQRVEGAIGTGRAKKSRPVRPPNGWEALTEAERRVVELAALGRTNREIGDQLFISHRTVGTHLAHAFDKLQVRSRVELANQVAQRSVTGTI
jgi:DNA-binding CsgD family transcriptional regulator/tetratricopeptide (TPR) repeat protein